MQLYSIWLWWLLWWQILDEWMGRSLIRSCAKLSYDHAQLMIDSPGGYPWGDAMPGITSKPSGTVRSWLYHLLSSDGYTIQDIATRIAMLNKVSGVAVAIQMAVEHNRCCVSNMCVICCGMFWIHTVLMLKTDKFLQHNLKSLVFMRNNNLRNNNSWNWSWCLETVVLLWVSTSSTCYKIV